MDMYYHGTIEICVSSEASEAELNDANDWDDDWGESSGEIPRDVCEYDVIPSLNIRSNVATSRSATSND